MAPITILLCFTLLIPSGLTQCTTWKALPFFRRSVYEFSVDLVKRIALEQENHFISSTLSPWTLISALSLGATEETLDEIKQVLRLHPHKCFNSKFFELVQELTEANDGTKLERSSTVFVDERLPLQQVFKDRIEKTKVTNLQALPFEDPNAVATIINEYIRTATHDTIDDVVELSDLQDVYLVLIDALYFKGSWAKKFENEDTEVSAFYDEQGNQIGDVNLMFSTQEANLTNVKQIGASVLELPYGNNKRFSMLFILPDNEQSIASVLDKMKTISLSSIFTLFGETQGEVFIQIPRFKIESDLGNLKELLRDMGLRSMFDASLAKFADIADYNLFVSNFIQKASIEVTEEGTEASAASAAFMAGRSLNQQSEQFTANRPFLFMIVDRHLELALFTGAYSKPTVY